ncbi:MAG: hypothetical protein HGB02_03715 [Chlorobiaceae bacterium]|nr:hypothetical protein [Chlorobiaceae bacterium]
MIALRRTSDPAAYPVIVADVKTYGRIGTTAHDTMLDDLIAAATAEVEEICSRALITQTWELVLPENALCGRDIMIPRPPLQSVTSVQYTDSNGDQQTASADLYQVDIKAEPGRIKLEPGSQWPAVGVGYSEPVMVKFVAGYGDASTDVPQKIKQAIIALVVHWYDNGIGTPIPSGVHRVLDNYKVRYEL